MIASLILGALTAVSTVAPSPAPAASATPAIPEIIHTVTSEACTTLQNLLMPVGYVTKRNDDAFGGMQTHLLSVVNNFNSHDMPTQAELMALGDSKDVTTGANVSQIDPSGQDDNLLYSPKAVLEVAKMDSIANQIYSNLAVEASFMDKSWKEYPAGADPKVDKMRQDAQNLMDLQRALADKYENFSKTYLNNQELAWTKDPGEREFFKAYLRALLLGQAAAFSTAGTNSLTNGLTKDQVAKIGSVADVVNGLRNAEHLYAPEQISTYNTCNGTTIPVPTPAPQ